MMKPFPETTENALEMSVKLCEPFHVYDEAEEVVMTEEESVLEEIDDGIPISLEGDDSEEEYDLTCTNCNQGILLQDGEDMCPRCGYKFKMTKHGFIDDGFVQDKVEYDRNDSPSESEAEYSDDSYATSSDEDEEEFDYGDDDEDYVPPAKKRKH